ASMVTLSTAQAEAPAATGLKHTTAEAVSNDDQPQAGSSEIAGETAGVETIEAVTAVPKKPAFKLPTIKLPKLKLPALKLSTPKKATRPATTPSASAPDSQADNDSAASSPKPGHADSSERSGNANGTDG
ncbi:MAG: hypothetical protein K0R33_2428, partial [Mycobacterium sp.]|nr:hypothetical protein [Mycobacterium sp.]